MKILSYILWILLWFFIHSFIFAGWIMGDYNWIIKSAAAALDCFILVYGFRLLKNNFVPTASGKQPQGKSNQRPYGLYNTRGELMSAHEAIQAIERFDRHECDTFLRKFGKAPGSADEELDQVRQRCVKTLALYQ